MKQDRYRIASGGSFIMLSLLALLCVVGCTHNQARVIPAGNRQVAALSADDIVRVMRRAGFPDEQIEQLGPELRDALAFHGAAGIRSGEHNEALFLVDGYFIYVAVRGRGGFFYDVRKKPVYGQPK